MIFISGKRASGKSESGRILEDYGFATYDAGPELRKRVKTHNLIHDTTLSAEEFVQHMISTTGNEHWAVDFDVNNIVSLVEDWGRKVNVIGYRDYGELCYCLSNVNSITGRDFTKNLVYLKCDYDIAVERFEVREQLDRAAAQVQLQEQYEYEDRWGVSIVEDNADFVIENNGTIRELRQKLLGAVASLGYEITQGGKYEE